MIKHKKNLFLISDTLPMAKSYRDALSNSKLNWKYATGLKDHLASPKLADITIKYEVPYILDERGTPNPKTAYDSGVKKIRLPARLNNPLIPYPSEIRTAIGDMTPIEGDLFHGHHRRDVNLLISKISVLQEQLELQPTAIRFDVPSLKMLVKCQHSDKTELINLTALEFAKRATSHDLSIAAMTAIQYQPNSKMKSPYLSFLIAMQRLRVLLCNQSGDEPLTEMPHIEKDRSVKVHLFEDGSYMHVKYDDAETHCLIVANGHFAMYHSQMNYWFAGPFSYLDYALTLADTINNLEILSYDASYSWAREFFLLLINLAESDKDHNMIVNFMKSFEGFILNMSDYDEEFPMNWVPLMEGMYELWGYDQRFSSTSYDFSYLPALLHDPSIMYPKTSYLCRFIVILMKMDRTQMQEVSSLHKFVFYSEVDSEAGVKKFLKRVHTPRPVDVVANKAITHLAKQEFILSYCRKHKSLPTLRCSDQKLTILKIHFNNNTMDKLKDYPLPWWNDIQPWACMDSTLTDDALEFAKDKGALKKEIKFGPGDSRKELLQLIESPSYTLKDLMANGNFKRQSPKVYRTRQQNDDVKHEHPARLIPKEREQKWEARLFANGELSNKHALSVITTKMKKVLSYFSEQLMTPSDSKRKLMLHRIGQTLREPDKFSLLLDIEGHNQSMQDDNTSELLEFMGCIFGETGWGSLSNYFGALLVYHYDEYKDDVIVSKGQKGGIEGWMNPAWTLHTLLMMKLLRVQTDLEIPDLMVYSDDVNAVIKLEQATEASIQSVFSKIMKHCIKFGMIAKMSQTTLSKHRATMLRQHYSEGVRADSTLKRLMAVSGANNGMVMSEELEVAGICSSAASALEFSNHSETCCYLKNYKIGILLARLPQMILSHPQKEGMLSSEELPSQLAELLYHIKDDSHLFSAEKIDETILAVKNDVARYLQITGKMVSTSTMAMGLHDFFNTSLARERLVDNPDRVLYLQVYDKFVQDLLFFWVYLPTSLGGMGAITHIDMILSGHSNGFSKAVHYLHQWISKYSYSPSYLLKYLAVVLTNSNSDRSERDQWEILTAKWPSERTITSASTSLGSSIRSMVKKKTKNTNVLALFRQAEMMPVIAQEMVKIFRNNYHPRIAQFYYENSSVHFLDLLINKIETSSGLLGQINNLQRLRKSLVMRTIGNIRIASAPREHVYGNIFPHTDIIDYLMRRRAIDFPTISFIQAEEILYDNKLELTADRNQLVSVRKCSPLFFKDGLQVYNDPRIGDEVTYKGDYLDRERMVGNKEELLAARVVSVTMWLLTKTNNLGASSEIFETYDCAQGCNLTLKTLTGQTLLQLMPYCPTETGGEILHRIPNMRFSSNTYIRSEMNLALSFVAELSQQVININSLIDSNINFDYVRMRLICAAIVQSKFKEHTSVLARYKLTNMIGICDVQFVSPQPLDWTSKLVIEPYSRFRGHVFSNMRFRFLAGSYLSIDDLTDLALLPMQENAPDMQSFGRALKREIVYKYARSIDKEYMSASLAHPREDVWRPVYYKLGILDPSFKALSDTGKFEESIKLLQEELEDRGQTKVIRAHDKTSSLLQSECLMELMAHKPDDQIYQTLLATYLLTLRQNGSTGPILERINVYNQLLMTQNHHKATLCRALICEIILTLHFHTIMEDSMISFDVQTSFHQFLEVGIVNQYLQSVNPELYAQTQILGTRMIMEYAMQEKQSITEFLYDISMQTMANDVVIPSLNLSIRSQSTLPVNIQIPDAADMVIFMAEEVGMEAMRTIKDIKGICKYADKCCDFGASPAVFESITGSDTFCSQYGFFRLLMQEFGIDDHTRICDLTAGRGDGLYAGQALGLNMTSYSQLDNFTAILHHPEIQFDKEYDITRSNTIDFVTGFDFVHIDVSFLKNGKDEVGDLILYLESNLIPYSLRLNSVSLEVYSSSMHQLQSEYTHHVAYCVSDIWRVPQIYLIGIPDMPNVELSDIPLKETVAFRAMALSFTELLKHSFEGQALDVSQMNSISACLPDTNRMGAFLKHVTDSTVSEEKNYYLRRFKTEFSADSTIYLNHNFIPQAARAIMESMKEDFIEIRGSIYTHYTEDDIGHVSVKALPFLMKHLDDLHDSKTEKIGIKLQPKHRPLLKVLRIHHPIRTVRSLCNVLLGVLRLCPEIEEFTLQGLGKLTSASENGIYLKPSRHQEELITALKLLMLSVHYNQPILGLLYCSLMSQNYPTKSAYMCRVRKRYKLMSGLRTFIYNHFQSGNTIPADLLVMADELFSKRPHQFKQGLKYAKDKSYMEDYSEVRQLLDVDFDALFMKFEHYALSKEDDLLVWPAGEEEIMDVMSGEVNEFNSTVDNNAMKLNVNIDVEAIVDKWAASRGLTLDPITGRYEGFITDDWGEPEEEDSD